MVTTRSQSNRIREVHNRVMDRSSDNESETSLPDILSRDQMAELDTDDLLNRQRNTDGYSIDQRFNEINRQIGDLTNIVLTLTQQFSSNNREGNRLNVATINANSRSDMVTGVPNPQPSGSRTTPPNGTRRSDTSIPQLTDVMTEIRHLRNTMGDAITQAKILQTQIPLFKETERNTMNSKTYYLIIYDRMLTNSLRNRNTTISRASSEMTPLNSGKP